MKLVSLSCPKCGCRSKVLYTRHMKSGEILRARLCTNEECKHPYRTIQKRETLESDYTTVTTEAVSAGN